MEKWYIHYSKQDIPVENWDPFSIPEFGNYKICDDYIKGFRTEKEATEAAMSELIKNNCSWKDRESLWGFYTSGPNNITVVKYKVVYEQ